MINSPLGRLRLVAIIEGVSFLLLLGVAMPLKYLAHMPIAVRVTGMVHGILFILFCLALVQVVRLRRWQLRRSALVFISSLIPCGTFIMDARLKRWGAE